MTFFSKTAFLLAVSPLVLCAQNAPPADPLIASSQDLFTQIRDLVLRSADKIPADAWSFRATPDVRTIGQLFAHIADAEYHICGLAIDGQPHDSNIEKTMTDKAAITAALKNSFAFCAASYTKLTPATAVQTIDLSGAKRTRIAEMDYGVAHAWEHYGNLVTYMRLKGIVPPSSEASSK